VLKIPAFGNTRNVGTDLKAYGFNQVATLLRNSRHLDIRPNMNEIKNRIDNLPPELDSIANQLRKYVENNSNINDLVLNVLHRPWVARLNWGIMLYQRADVNWFVEYTKRTGKEIPKFYMDFLKNINGGFIYNLSLYGLAPSIYNSGQLNRCILQCHDLTTANINWIGGYDVDPNLFHFGGRSYTYDENVGYFFDNEKILCYRKNGELIKKWDTFSQMLSEEIKIVEQKMLDDVPKEIDLIIN